MGSGVPGAEPGDVPDGAQPEPRPGPAEGVLGRGLRAELAGDVAAAGDGTKF